MKGEGVKIKSSSSQQKGCIHHNLSLASGAKLGTGPLFPLPDSCFLQLEHPSQ
jgi:hypothetical protein